jgi:hypothetical protein
MMYGSDLLFDLKDMEISNQSFAVYVYAMKPTTISAEQQMHLINIIFSLAQR